MPILLKNHTSTQLHARLAHAGVSPHLARRLLAAAVKRGELPAPGSHLTARLRDDLLPLKEIPHLSLVQKVVSRQDGFTVQERHAHSKHAEATMPSLDDWEKEWQKTPQHIAQLTPCRAASRGTDRMNSRVGLVLFGPAPDRLWWLIWPSP